MELLKEQVFLDQCVGSEQHQIMLEGEILIPDAKPDMQLILQNEEYIRIDHNEISTDRVHFAGKMNLWVLYMAKGADKDAQVLAHEHDVNDFVNVDGADKGMSAWVKAEVANAELRMINDRKVSYRVVVNILAHVERSDAHDMVVHINGVPENQLLKKPLNVNRTIENRTDTFTIAETLYLSSGKPNVREVLLVTPTIASSDERLTNGRLNISGELLVTTLYRGETEERLIELIENAIPFNGTFDVSGAREDMHSDVTLQVTGCNVRILPDDDGEDRLLELEVTVSAQMKIYSTETLNVLEDAYSIDKELHLSGASILIPRLICHNRNAASVKEVVTLPAGVPDMLQVFRVRGVVHLDDTKVMDDKVVVEGVINTDVLYVAESDAQPLGAFRSVVPFRQVIEAKGTQPGMRVTVNTSIDQATFNMLSPRETEVRFMLTFNTRVIHETEARIINNVSITDPDEINRNDASLIVYLVQNDDTLWSIAKRYNTPLDTLLSTNGIEANAPLTPGQKLLLVK
ncbi:MAG: DUF3794 domain-containing protein [Defluviitaleaceae bacterium]|nr:DUF3794 domain-containing protein [Defluviitaleaceae bacterium]